MISDKTQQDALAIAKSTQKPGQTKEQTKLIAKGIEKGIAEYKKQQKQKARAADKAKKKRSRQREETLATDVDITEQSDSIGARLPWLLLLLSWCGFIAYQWFS